MERIRHRGLEIALGLILTFALLAGLVIIWESFSGRFSNKIAVNAQLSQIGDSLEPGDIVTYRSVIIGEVASAAGNGQGGAVARLQIDPGAASQIPASVTAVAVPASLFGTTKIELLPPADLSGPRLSNGDTINPDTNPSAESLQTALAKAYTLLTAIHPAELDAALGALAQALQGQGPQLGQLLVTADNYLKGIGAHLPQLDDVITSLATVTNEIAKNAPQLLHSLSNTLVLANGILASKQAVANLLAVAPTVLDNTTALFNQTTIDNTVAVITNETPVSAALAANPNALADTIQGFKAFADTFSTVIHGSSARGTLTLTGANLAQLIPMLTNGTGHIFDASDNPPLYTSANCPRYGSMAGSNCSGAAGASASAQLLTSGSGFGGGVSSIGSASEQSTVTSAGQLISGDSNLNPTVADLLLGPLLRGSVTVLR
jgi:phospholipid/cholesterol/gamma-HCH transport system substrate-binding protein